MRYEIVVSDNRQEVIDTVEMALSEGWELQGGVSVTFGKAIDGSNLIAYAQAIVKNKKGKK